MLFLRSKWKLKLYYKGLYIGTKLINANEKPTENSYVVRVLFREQLFGGYNIQTVVKPIKLLKTEEKKKTTHFEVVIEEGVDV